MITGKVTRDQINKSTGGEDELNNHNDPISTRFSHERRVAGISGGFQELHKAKEVTFMESGCLDSIQMEGVIAESGEPILHVSRGGRRGGHISSLLESEEE